jgi:N-methylhydantoinase A
MKRIAVDIGGTFTDIVLVDDERAEIITDKVRSTPRDIGRAVFEAIAKIDVDMREVSLFVHGTTVGLNTVVQRKGSRVGLITTNGFTDVLEMGRGDRKELYGYLWRKPEPLVPREFRMGIDERMNHLGQIVKDVDRHEVEDVVHRLKESGVEAVAVCFLHSYANPSNEKKAGAIIGEIWPEVGVSLSHQVAREFREYERMSSTVLDAYVKKRVVEYLTKLFGSLKEDNFSGQLLIVSPGGVLGLGAIKEKTIATFASGPIGGVAGSSYIADATGVRDLVNMDVGGTSFDVSLIRNGAPLVRHQSELLGYPILLPGMDIRPIGAGGGSIARVDAGGLLTVGPESAGADPGPMCYGLGGTEPTVTDAALVNGLIDPQFFLGGEISLDMDLAYAGVEAIARRLNLTVNQTAEGILTVARNNMTTATKEILIGQGYDPRDFALMSYGGAGGIFAAGIARDMSMAKIIVPLTPGVFSARGMLTMDITHGFAQTLARTVDALDLSELIGIFEEMKERGLVMLREERIPDDAIEFVRSLDMSYEGQGHYVEVPVSETDLHENAKALISGRFHDLHKIKYGHRMDAPVKTINVRMKAVGKIPRIPLKEFELTDRIPDAAFKTKRKVYMEGKLEEWNIVDRDYLLCGNVVTGPVIVEEAHHTTMVWPDQLVRVDRFRNLVIEAVTPLSSSAREAAL